MILKFKRPRPMTLAAVTMAVSVLLSASPLPRGPQVRPTNKRVAPTTHDRLLPGDALSRIGEEARPAEDGSLLIQNGAYRASFTRARGVVFTPQSDGGNTRRLTWQYRARALERGQTRLDLAAVDPRVSRTGRHIVDFERPGLIERYVGESRGIEQVFVLTARPKGSGDVRVRGEVTCPERAVRAGTSVEYGRGRSRLTYGQPMAVDAHGRRLAVRTDIRGSALDLVLDEAAVDHATFPVTIDPMVVAIGPIVTATQIDHVDATFNVNLGEFLVAYSAVSERDSSVREIRVVRRTAGQEQLGPPVVISTGFFDDRPTVAFSMYANRYLVVWQRRTSVFTSVCARLLASDATPIGAAFLLNLPNRWAYHPDVAARNFRESARGPAFFVAWRETAGEGVYVERALVNADATQIARAKVSTQDMPLPIDEDLADQAAAYDPLADRFYTVWNENQRIWGRTADGASGSPGTAGEVTGIDSVNARHPAIAFEPGRQDYLVAWADDGWDSHGKIVSRVFLQYMWSGANPAKEGGIFTRLPPHDLGQLSWSHDYPALTAEVGGYLLGYEFIDVFGSRCMATGISPDNNILLTSSSHCQRPSLATNHYGFSLMVSNDSDGLSVMAGLLYNNFFHFVHGKSGDFGGSPDSDLFSFRPWGPDFLVSVLTSAGVSTFQMGDPGDVPLLMDVDNDGIADIGMFRPSNGTWYIRHTTTAVTTSVAWGKGGDIPVPGDYVGDGADDEAVFRPGNGTWYIRDATTGVTTQQQWGQVGDVPVPADFDGDGKLELCVWRPRSGDWHRLKVGAPTGTIAKGFGKPGDIPLQGNFVGGPSADQAFYRPATGTWYFREGWGGNQTSIAFEGLDAAAAQGHAMVPVPLDWNNDGTLDLVLVDDFDQFSDWFIRLGPASTKKIAFGLQGGIQAGGS